MSIASFIAGLVSPSFRKRERFCSISIHPDAKVLYEDFLGFCAIRAYGGFDGSETVGNLVERMKSCFGPDVCANMDDFRTLLAGGGWDQSVDEQMEVHPALFEAIAFATQGMPRRILEPVRLQEQAGAYVDNMTRRHNRSDQTAFVASPTNVAPITPDQSVPDFSNLHFATVTPLPHLTGEDNVVFSSEPPQINEAQYDEVIDRLVHYRNGPGYISLWDNILSELDLPDDADQKAILLTSPLQKRLRHDNRFSVEEADNISFDLVHYLLRALPYDYDHEIQLRQEEDAAHHEQERLRQMRLQNRNDLLASAAEQQERITNFIPNVLSGFGRSASSALRTAVGVSVAAALIARQNKDRRNR